MALKLPADWADPTKYDAQKKIDWFNDNDITAKDLKSAGIDDGTINWMLANGLNKTPSAAEESAVTADIAQDLYSQANDAYTARINALATATGLARSTVAARVNSGLTDAQIRALAQPNTGATNTGVTNTGVTNTTTTTTPTTTTTTGTTNVKPSTVYTGTSVSGPTATGSGLSALKAQNQERPVYKDATFGFRAPYEAPTELAPAKGLGQLVSQYVGQPNLRTMTRSIGPGGMGVLTEQPSAGLSYATRPGGIGESQYFQNIADYFSDPTITPQSAAYEMYRYNIPETDIQAAIGMTPTEFFAQRAAQQVQPAAPTVTTNTGISALAPPPISYEKPGFSTPFTGGLSFAMQPGGIGRTQYLNNIASYLNKGVSPGSLAADMAQYGVTSDDLIAARAMFPGGAPSQAGMPISIATSTGTTGTPEAPPVIEGDRAGGPIALAEGGKTEMAGEKKFSVTDFIKPNVAGYQWDASKDLATKQGYIKDLLETYDPYQIRSAIQFFDPTNATEDNFRRLGIARNQAPEFRSNVVFGPELKGLEAAALANMSPADREMALREMMIRQGLTGREYFPESMFGSTSVAPAIGYIPGVFGDRDRDEKGRPLRAMYRYAEGGGVGRGLGSIAMKGYAQEMAQKGRFGDTMLAHISPEEAQMLQAAGGAGTINPQTGLPEYFSWRKLLKKVAPIVQFAAPFIPGIGPLAAAAISGVAGGFSGPGGFNFKRGLMSGLMSYGMGQMAKGIEAAGQVGQAPVVTPDVAGNEVANLASRVPPSVTNASIDLDPITNMQPPPTTYAPISQASQPITPSIGDYFSRGADRLNQLYTGASNLATNVPGAYDAAKQAMGMTFGQAGIAAGTGALGIMGENERLKYLEEQKAKGLLKAEEEKEYEDLFRRLMGNFAGGGEIAAMVAGGATGPANEPRTINGAGDGMSDSVPATIEGVQEARLADGEFVIPADVVADLGNGSSNAGSKKLYAMMDRVRKARHGTTRQPPEVDTGRLMPA